MDLNNIKCHNFEKCGNYAMTLWGKIWLCGECTAKLAKKIEEKEKKEMEDMLFEE